MPRVERSGTRVASAKTMFANDEIVSKVRETAPYLTFLTQVTLVLVEILLHRGIPIPLMDESFVKLFMKKVRTPFGRGRHAAMYMYYLSLLFPRSPPVDLLYVCYRVLFSSSLLALTLCIVLVTVMSLCRLRG